MAEGSNLAFESAAKPLKDMVIVASTTSESIKNQKTTKLQHIDVYSWLCDLCCSANRPQIGASGVWGLMLLALSLQVADSVVSELILFFHAMGTSLSLANRAEIHCNCDEIRFCRRRRRRRQVTRVALLQHNVCVSAT